MSNLQNNIASLEALITKANALPEEKTIQSSKTVTPTTSSQTIKPDSGYDGMGQVVVNAIPDEYIDTTDATATRNHIISGYTAYVNGSKITGAIPQQSSSALTASGAKVSVPMGYYPYPMSKSIPITTMLTPSISVGDDGVITARAQVSTSGYVAAVTKTGTTELTTQAAKTITPTKSSQTAVAKNVYTTGAVTVAAIPSQYQDVSGVTATAATTLTGSKFVNSSGTLTSGTMPNNGSTSKTIDGLETKSATIPAGYTTGGTISLDSTIDNTANSQADLIAQISEALEGKAIEGGESAAYSAINGTFTYQQSMSAPGTYEYYLYWDNPANPQQAPILGVYCVYIDTETSSVFKHLVACLEQGSEIYRSNCTVFQQSASGTAYSDYVKLPEAIIVTGGRY